MSYRLRRKSRQQADVEIYGGPLHQKRFDGGMNIDSPASEIKSNEVAYAENVIFREFGMEARPGTVQYSTNAFITLTTTNILAYCYNPASYTGTYANYRHTINYNGTIRSYRDNPTSTYLDSQQLDGVSATGTYSAGTGDTTMLPFRRGWLTCTASKISYTDPLGSFQINSPNPVHGVGDQGSGTFKYRYLLTLSRIITYTADPSSGSISADRLTTGAEVVIESGTNGKRYRAAGPTSTARDRDYGEVSKSTAIAVGDGFAIPNSDLVPAFSSIAAPDNDAGAALHFTHVSIYRTADVGDAGIALGNNKAIYVWVADVKKSDAASGFTDTISDEVLANRQASQNLILKTQGFTPMPSGSCAEMAGGWLFISDRSNATPENYVHYCAISSIENIGYYFSDIQKYRFNDGVRAMRANGDILSIFCNNSSHICNLTAINSDASKIQYIPFLTYWHTVDRSLGIKDWGTLDSIDENSMIAVCSDASVRIWDTAKWGEDLAYNHVSSEIRKIVPASTLTYARGSVGKFYNGAYYLWYSTSSSDTATTKCLRYAFGKQAGYGWGYYTGWVYPPFKCGAQIIVDNIGVQRLIVMDSADGGRFNWVETFLPFTGALDNWSEVYAAAQLNRFDTDRGTYDTAGTAIASTWKFRELIGSEEADVLIHDESFHRWRPRVESAGYLTGMTVSMSAYKDGSTTAAETVTLQPRTASVKFTKEIAARRVQLGVATAVGGWRYVGIDSHFRSLDKINFAVAGDNSSSESTTSYPQYQAALSTDMKHWITRRETDIDRATVTKLTSAGTISLITGPDLKSYSAHQFGADSAHYTESASYLYSGDFTISFWIKAPPYNVDIFRISGSYDFYVQFTDATTMNLSGMDPFIVLTVASGWHHFAIVRSGDIITLYQNGVVRYAINDSGSSDLGGGNLSLGAGSSVTKIADFRIYTKVLTADQILYYYNDVINNYGDQVMPQI